jgi:capsular polysaccharide transport system permease protein
VRGVLIQLQVIHAILLREVRTRFGNHQWGYAWALIGPLLWVGAFAALYHLLGRMAPPGMSVMSFLITGIVTFEMFRNTSNQATGAISGNKGLLFYPQVRPLDLVMARSLLEGMTQIIVFAVLLCGVALYEGRQPIDNVLTTITGVGLAIGLGASLGLVSCCLSTMSPTFERIHGMVMRPMFWFSAVFYPIDSVPTGFRDALLYNPVVHAIELVRDGWFPGYQTRHIDPWYPAMWIICLFFLGLSLERVARRSLELS